MMQPDDAFSDRITVQRVGPGSFRLSRLQPTVHDLRDVGEQPIYACRSRSDGRGVLPQMGTGNPSRHISTVGSSSNVLGKWIARRLGFTLDSSRRINWRHGRRSPDLTLPDPRRFSIRLPRPLWIGLVAATLIVITVVLQVGVPIVRRQAAIREIERLGGYVELFPLPPRWLPAWMGHRWV